MSNFFKNLFWYPPAETKLPWSLIVSGCLPSRKKPEDAFCSMSGATVPVVFGCSGRALLCELLIHLKTSTSEKRNEILIPGYTCYSVAAAVARAGLKISVYDLDPSDFSPDPASLEKNASRKTLSILSQHLLGVPTAVEIVSAIAAKVGAAYIEDAAQALGGTLYGKPLGTFGDFGLFSFGRGKPLPLGGGGALIGKDSIGFVKKPCPKSSLGMKTMAACAAARIIGEPLFYGIAEGLPLGLGQTVFDPDFEQSDMALFSRRLLSHADDLLEKMNSCRRRVARIYEQAFNGLGTVPVPENSTPVYTRYPLFVKNNSIADQWRRLGIRRMYPEAIVDEPSIGQHLSDAATRTPGATEIARKLITLPTHLEIDDSLAMRISSEIKKSSGGRYKGEGIRG